MAYRVVKYNGNTGHFKESLYVYDLKGAIGCLKWKCEDIIDDFLHDGICMKASMLGFDKAIRIFDINDEMNYYVVFLKKVEEPAD